MKIHKNISDKTLIGAKPLRIRFDKVDGFIRIYFLFGPENANYNRIRDLIDQKSYIIYIFSYNYAKIKIDSYDFFPVEESLTLHNVIMPGQFLIKVKITITIIYS